MDSFSSKALTSLFTIRITCSTTSLFIGLHFITAFAIRDGGPWAIAFPSISYSEEMVLFTFLLGYCTEIFTGVADGFGRIKTGSIGVDEYCRPSVEHIKLCWCGLLCAIGSPDTTETGAAYEEEVQFIRAIGVKLGKSGFSSCSKFNVWVNAKRFLLVTVC